MLTTIGPSSTRNVIHSIVSFSPPLIFCSGTRLPIFFLSGGHQNLQDISLVYISQKKVSRGMNDRQSQKIQSINSV